MAEYIEREALIQQMADNFRQGVWDGCSCGEYRIAEDTILEAPAADVTEVVRCKDCKYHNAPPCPMRLSLNWTKDNDFCSYGERRNDAAD